MAYGIEQRTLYFFDNFGEEPLGHMKLWVDKLKKGLEAATSADVAVEVNHTQWQTDCTECGVWSLWLMDMSRKFGTAGVGNLDQLWATISQNDRKTTARS